MRLSFIGDLIFGDQPVTFGYGFDSVHSKNQYHGVFNGVKENLSGSAVVVGNFESVILPRHATQTISNWAMCCDATVVKQLHQSNIRIVSLANNHTMDYGDKGYLSTKKELYEHGIATIGDLERPFLLREINGSMVGIIGASYLKVSCQKPLYFYRPDREQWNNAIKLMRNKGAEIIIVYLHWGNEFISLPNEEQVNIAEMLTEMGIDLIVGCHAHILQNPTLINEAPVYFGLGNFISDYWQSRLRKTVILHAEISGNRISLFQDECEINDMGCALFKRTNSRIHYQPVQIATKEIISKERYRVRLEYLLHLLRNFHRIKGKGDMTAWLFRRLVYLIKYFRQELHDPNVLYEKYKN